MSEKKWYVVRAVSGQENKIKTYIENEISRINDVGINTEMQLECEKEECQENGEPFTFTSKVNFDPVNFFTAS